MFSAFRISKKTFFAAAAASLSALVPAHAYLFEDDELDWRVDANGAEVANGIVRVDNDTASTYIGLIGATPWTTFVKTGNGILQVTSLGSSGGLFSQHPLGYSHDDDASNDGAYWVQDRVGGLLAGNVTFFYGTASGSRDILQWSSGELVVDEGTLNLTGYVNAWYDFGPKFNSNALGQTEGAMTGVSRITVRNGTVLDLSGNNSFREDNSNSTVIAEMVVEGSYTTFQFLNNLQAGDTGTDINSALRLGTSTAFHVNLHVGGWNENERVDTRQTKPGELDTSKFDTQLAFGGSIGTIAGAGSIYKTGDGDFTLLGASTGFTGSLYAAGGSLILAADDSVGTTETFTDALGNTVRARVSSSVGNAASVNIAGTYKADGGSEQGSAIESDEQYATVQVDPTAGDDRVTQYTAVKEGYFTTPDAGTLVIAENQSIKNFQSYFNAGYRVANGTSAAQAVLAAANDTSGVLSPMSTAGLEQGASDAPIIAGTGTGSSLVIPGGNYTQNADGSWTLNKDADGYMQGGLLVIEQQAGMGGIYEGSIVGARVTIYDKTTFNENTERDETSANLDNADRLEAVKVKDAIQDAVDLTDDEMEILDIAEDGSFALDNAVAWKVVEYYKNPSDPSDTNEYYIDYEADASVKGGLLVLKGAGDFALLAENANYSGIVIDPSRTGKTVLNIAAVNALSGTEVSLGGEGTVSFVVNDSGTLDVTLDGFDEGSRLVFTTADFISTVSGQIKVGDGRQANISSSLVQESIRGNVYIERGIGLNLNGPASTFTNAASVTLWAGSTAVDDAVAAPSLTLSPTASGYVNQFVHNLTGDASARVSIGSGALTVTTDDNAADGYSGLNLGTFNGTLSGAGTLVKDGDATLTLGGGSSNASFTGDVAVAAGSLQLATANRLDGAGAVILNAGTSLTAEGDQALRALYGSAEASVSVNGVLTLGANAAPATGEIRPSVSNNLGTSETLPADDPAASFSRFQNCYDRKGNLILADNAVPASFANQKEATSAYLGAVAKTAYSGYDAAALKDFVGKKVYTAANETAYTLTQDDYEKLLAYAANGGRDYEDDATVAGGRINYKTLLGDLAELYGGLARTAEYEAAFAPTATSDGYWSPAGMKDLFDSTQAYDEYVAGLNATVREAYEEEYGEELPSNPTVSQKRQINAVLFDVLCEKYDELVGEKYWETGDYSYDALAGHFSGIEIDGGFGMALENADGTPVDASWIDDPAFAGTITATGFVKNGDGASKLTGTLNAANVVVNAGTLQIDHDTLAGTQTISVARGSSLSVDAAKGTSSVFGYALSGAGNFVKTGEGEITLGENVLYTGTTTLEAGTLQMSLRNPQTSAAEDGSLSTLAPQGNIIFAGSDTTLVLDQETDVAWANTIGVSPEDEVLRITLEKIGAGALTISGAVTLGEDAALKVSQGALTLGGKAELGAGSTVTIAQGATLSLSALRADDGVSLVGEGALNVTGDVSLSGGPAGTNTDDFTGTVTVASGAKLTLSGDSVLDHAREVAVRGTLNVASDQRVRALSGAGTVNIAENATLEIDRVGDRVGVSWMTGGVAGDYVFSEGVFADAPNFAGTVSGAGTLEVSGLGVSRFSDAVGVNVKVSGGGQVVLDAMRFTGKVTVDGSEKPVADANGNRLVGEDNQNGAENCTSGIFVEDGETGYLPRTFVTEDGETIEASSVTLYTNEDGKPAFKDKDGNEHVVAGVSAWKGYVDPDEPGELSANRVLLDEDGAIISDWSAALVWDADKKAYVPAEGVTDGYVRLAEDASGNLVAADMSSTTTAVSEVIFSVDATETANLDSEKLEITNGGYFGKAGDGVLSVNAASFAAAGRVSVYEGTLVVDGWIAADKIIAEGATLGMTLGDSVAPDLNSVFGSGTLELTGSGNITLGGDGAEENSTAVLSPTPTADGKFFNGEISFKAEAGKDYTVNIASGTTMTAVSTTAGVSLVLNDGVKFVQTRNTEFSGDVIVDRFVTVEGADENAGGIFDAAHRRLTISGALSGVGVGETGALILENVGFGFNASAPVDVRISGESRANAFYVDTAEGTDGGSSIGIAAGDAVLSELSLIKSGEKSYELTGSEIASGTSFFGVAIDARVLSVLANAGVGAVLNVGVEEGTLNIDLNGFTGTTAGGVNVDFVTLRSGTSEAAGTLEISATASSSPDAGTASLAAETVTAENGTTIFSETIKGSGNVVFDGSGNALKVNAAQAYTGTTTVSGNVAFEGDGRQNASSSFTVGAGAELRGGVALTGREVTVSGTAVRNANTDGSAGTTTLTLDISDPRLPSDLTCRVTLSGGGVQGAPVAIGTLPEGVSITGADYERGEDGAAGTLSLTIRDDAFGEIGETYTVSIPVNSSSLPSTAGGSSGVSGTATVAGNFTLDAGGSVVLDAATLGADGFAGIDAGAGTVTLNGSLFVDNLNESTRGKTLTLVSAESISRKGGYSGIYAVVKALRDTNEAMADKADWMKLSVDVAADGSVTAKMTTDNFSATGADYGAGVSDSFLSALSWLSSGGSHGESGIVNMAEALEKDPQLYALMNALSDLSSDRLADEVEKLSPSAFASMLAMPVEAFNADVARIHARLDQRRYDGANPLRETGEYEFFVLAQGDVAENGSGADDPVFDYNLYGATAGVDWKPDYRSTLGLAFGYTYGKAKMRNGGGKVEMDDMRVTAFGSRLIGDRFYVDGGLQAGTAMFDTRRETIAGAATGDTDAFFAGGFVTFGAVFTLSEDKKDGSGLYLMPNIGLSYLHESIDGFRESGTAGLDMDDADGDSLRARLAVALQWAFPFETWQVRLGVEAAYAHDFLGEDIDFDGRFTAGGNAFGTTAAALPTDVFSIGPTLDVGLTERDSLWLGYELEIDTDSGVSHGFNAGYRHRF